MRRDGMASSRAPRPGAGKVNEYLIAERWGEAFAGKIVLSQNIMRQMLRPYTKMSDRLTPSAASANPQPNGSCTPTSALSVCGPAPTKRLAV